MTGRRCGVRHFAGALVLVTSQLADQVRAADYAAYVGVGAMYSDNIQLSSNDPTGETVGLATTDFVMHSLGPRLMTDAAASLEFQKYSSATYSNQVVGNLAATAKYALVKERLIMVVQDNFGQQQIQADAVDTPNNRQRINYLSAGPDLNFPLSDLTWIHAAARYSDLYYQTTDLGNKRLSEDVSVSRRLSLENTVSLNGTNEKVMYDNTAENSDFTRQSAFGRFSRVGVRNSIEADLGVNRVSGSIQSSSDPLLRLSLTRRISPSTKLSFVAGQEISDAGNLLRERQTFTGGALDPRLLQSSDDPILTRYLRCEFEYTRNRTSLDLDVARYRDHHKVLSDLDRSLVQVDFRLRRNLTNALAVMLTDEFVRESFINPQFPDYSQNTVAAMLAVRAGRRLEVRAQIAHSSRTSKPGSPGFTENRVMLTVGTRIGNTTADIQSVSRSVF